MTNLGLEEERFPKPTAVLAVLHSTAALLPGGTPAAAVVPTPERFGWAPATKPITIK